jgi:hypothetical protein
MQAAVSICIIGPVGSGEVEVRRCVTLTLDVCIMSLITVLSAFMSIGQGVQQVRRGLPMTLRDIPKQKNLCVAMAERTSVSIYLISVNVYKNLPG